MEWELKGRILVPKSAPSPICTFIDETNLLGQTGFLQAAVPIPQDIYTQQLVPQCKILLTKLGKEAKEFKGSGIKPGNADIYLEFLRGFVNVAAHLGSSFLVFKCANAEVPRNQGLAIIDHCCRINTPLCCKSCPFNDLRVGQ
jgi:hypothetical protein